MLTRREMIAGVPGASLATPPASQRPNFIIFLTDDHGFADLGCQGAADLKTPHLDALAASGARFTNWYANAPVCAPSRGALLTGRYPQRNGVTANGNELAPGEHTIASLLKTAGYATAMTGKWHLGATPETCPNAHGFDYFFGFHSGCIDYYSHRFYWGEPRIVNYHDLWRNRTEVFEDGQYMTELITREATQWLARQKDHPFFLYVPFNGVHYPMVPGALSSREGRGTPHVRRDACRRGRQCRRHPRHSAPDRSTRQYICVLPGRQWRHP
jgi:arylsulfatase A-like enzyme